MSRRPTHISVQASKKGAKARQRKYAERPLRRSNMELTDKTNTVLTSFNAVHAHIRKSGQTRGNMTCPNCAGEIWYAQHTNGHIHMKCTGVDEGKCCVHIIQ